MTTKLKEVDVVIVGLGWTGGIVAKELSATGLKVVALERGGQRSTEADFTVPAVLDELCYVVRHDLMMNTQKDTITVRNNISQDALPMRRLGSFLPGEVVGGSGVHWSGHTWRWTDMEFKVRSRYEERYGKNFIPADMTIQDWGITYDELEPYYDKFEYTAAVSGKAGNIRGVIQPGGNPFEAPRERDYPLPPLTPLLAQEMFRTAALANGYSPFPRPSANASRAYTNPDGSRFGACQYCGHCQRFGCEANAKGSPHMTVIPVAMRNPNFELRTHMWVSKVLKDPGGKRVTGVNYTNVLNGEEFEQPASIVILTAYAINNVHLMLLSRIGLPLMRMTFDYKENEHKIGRHAAQVINDIAKSMNPTRLKPAVARTETWTVVPYQSTHNTGGTIMGTHPRTSALNKYLQSWDCHNLFSVGANVFPHNSVYNPTGPVGALAYWTADAIKNRYLKNPGPLVSA